MARLSGGHGPGARRLDLDNLKVILIAAVIVLHAVLGYAGTINAWTYAGLRETTLSPAVEGILLVLAVPVGLFMMSLLFLVAGLLTSGSMARKGPAAFARDRLLRLGIPFASYVLLIQPVVVYLLERPFGAATGSFWAEYLGAEGELDTGPLWFVGVLLLFSLSYAGLVALRDVAARPAVAVAGRARASVAAPIGAARLGLVAALVAVASFLVRLAYAYGSEAGFTDLNVWQWPASLAVFCVGLAGARRAWLTDVPDRLRRRCRAVTIAAMAAMAALLAVAGAADRVTDLLGGPQFLAAAFAGVEAVLNLFGPVWLLAVAQRHLDRPLRWAGPSVRRSAFGAFVVQTPVLLALAVLLRPAPLPAEAKAVAVAVAGVAGSFSLAWLLIRRVPGVARVL